MLAPDALPPPGPRDDGAQVPVGQLVVLEAVREDDGGGDVGRPGSIALADPGQIDVAGGFLAGIARRRPRASTAEPLDDCGRQVSLSSAPAGEPGGVPQTARPWETGIEQDQGGGLLAAAAGWLAISAAIGPPRQKPPSAYGPCGCTSRTASTYWAASSGIDDGVAWPSSIPCARRA